MSGYRGASLGFREWKRGERWPLYWKSLCGWVCLPPALVLVSGISEHCSEGFRKRGHVFEVSGCIHPPVEQGLVSRWGRGCRPHISIFAWREFSALGILLSSRELAGWAGQGGPGAFPTNEGWQLVNKLPSLLTLRSAFPPSYYYYFLLNNYYRCSPCHNLHPAPTSFPLAFTTHSPWQCIYVL